VRIHGYFLKPKGGEQKSVRNTEHKHSCQILSHNLFQHSSHMLLLQKGDTLFVLHKLCLLVQCVIVISAESELQGTHQEW
jgi:hypothetical protein